MLDLVVGDSVSIGWTPVLSGLIDGSHVVTHSPGKLADGGARSTSNFLNCHGTTFQHRVVQIPFDL